MTTMLAALALLAAHLTPVLAANRAFLVGINDYANLDKLAKAVIAQSFERIHRSKPCGTVLGGPTCAGVRTDPTAGRTP